MIKKLHGLDGYSFMTTPASVKYFISPEFDRKSYEQCVYSIDFSCLRVFLPMDKYLVLRAVLFFFEIENPLIERGFIWLLACYHLVYFD